MNVNNLILFMFLLSAVAIGAGLQDAELDIIMSGIDNASEVVKNISIINVNNSSHNGSISKGILTIIESGIHFAGTLGVETMRMGVLFGKENPDYFSAVNLMKLAKWMVVLIIVSLLIRPVSYLVVFLVMIFLWVVEKRKISKTCKGRR